MLQIYVRSIAHALHSTSDDNTLIAGLNALCSEHDRLHTTGANFVDSGGIGRRLHPCTESDLPRRRLANTSLNDVAEVDLLSDSRIDL
jgi:hypothetical protein